MSILAQVIGDGFSLGFGSSILVAVLAIGFFLLVLLKAKVYLFAAMVFVLPVIFVYADNAGVLPNWVKGAVLMGVFVLFASLLIKALR